jgi:hypothetical protein
MPFGNTSANDIAKLIFQAIAIANVADNAASSPLTNLHIALHTADPGAGGSQTTSEASYTGYLRVAVARTSGGFTVTVNVVTNTAEVAFPISTSGPQTVTWFSIGTASSGAGKILLRGQLSGGGLVINNAITPRFAAGVLSATFVV